MRKPPKFKRHVLAQTIMLGICSGQTHAAFNMTIGFGPNTAVTGSSPFMPTASGANLNILTLLTALELGDVTIDTAGAGIEDGDITLNGDLDFAGATASNDLTFDADGDIFINGTSIVQSPMRFDMLNCASFFCGYFCNKLNLFNNRS